MAATQRDTDQCVNKSNNKSDMEIKGKVHCFFEQSGTFKNEFIKLGIPAEDYDIQNNFGETDHTDDLFQAIEDAWDGRASLFDQIRGGQDGDLIMAFFPCIHFCGVSQTAFGIDCKNYKGWSIRKKIDYIVEKNHNRAHFFDLLNKFVGICLERDIRMIFENPISGQGHLRVFLKQPDVQDFNRMMRGDYMVKPTGYWFWNCTPTHGSTIRKDKEQLSPNNLKKGASAGLCSEERSMISPDYARNFICDFILGKEQQHSQMSLW